MVVEAIEHALERDVARGATLLLAVSGGVDSMVLLHALAEIGPRRGLGLAVGHVHHGLRGEAADRDRAAVEEAAAALAIPFQMEAVAPGVLRTERSSRERPTLQEAARTVRYAALRRMAATASADHIVTAHTLDDQAETVLMRLLRGAGPDALGGIPERSADGILIRPMLAIPRVRIESFAWERGLAWREDESNRCDRYTRNRLRHHWLPGLAREFNPRLLRAIGRLAEAQRRDAEWIEAIVEDAAARMVGPGGVGPGDLVLRSDGWPDLPEALARRVVRALLVRMGAGRDVTSTHILRMLDFLRADVRQGGRRTLELPGGLRVVETRDGFVVRRIRG